MAESRTPRRRWTRWRTSVVWLVVATLGFGLAWIVVTGFIARHQADRVSGELADLESDLTHGRVDAARALEARMQHQTAAAHNVTSGPAWWVAAHLPGISGPAKEIRGGTTAINTLAHHALPEVLTAGTLLDPQSLRTGRTRLDVERLQQSVDPLTRAVQSMDVVLADTHGLPRATWLDPVNHRLTKLIGRMTQLRQSLASLSTAVNVLPRAIGAAGTRRYFVAFETEAESRGLGGLPGAYAILSAHRGELRLSHFGLDTDLRDARAHVDLDADYKQEFDQSFAPESNFGNSDPSPHFPDAARIWISMWEEKFHQRLNGAIATDPTTLGYLLGAVGPVRITPGVVMNKSNAASFFENRIYQRFGNNNIARKKFQLRAARLASMAVIHQPSSDLLRAVTATQQAAAERRLLVYSTDPVVEHTLASSPVGGFLPRTTRPFLDVVVNNTGANKLDYYLDRTVTYRRASCAAGTADVTITLSNTAPSSGLSPTVVGQGGTGRKAGLSSLLVSVYGTKNSLVQRVTLDGKPIFFNTQQERGHPVTIIPVSLAPGQSRSLRLSIREPAADGPIVALRQPLVRPLKQTVMMPRCA
jgi:hypothetical protein